jgi:hypothetical protein
MAKKIVEYEIEPNGDCGKCESSMQDIYSYGDSTEHCFEEVYK